MPRMGTRVGVQATGAHNVTSERYERMQGTRLMLRYPQTLASSPEYLSRSIPRAVCGPAPCPQLAGRLAPADAPGTLGSTTLHASDNHPHMSDNHPLSDTPPEMESGRWSEREPRESERSGSPLHLHLQNLTSSPQREMR